MKTKEKLEKLENCWKKKREKVWNKSQEKVV